MLLVAGANKNAKDEVRGGGWRGRAAIGVRGESDARTGLFRVT